MKTLITNIAIASALSSTLSIAPAAAQNVAIKADYVFAVNSKLMERCAGDYEFNMALSNNATTKDDTLAVRDLIRTFRDCENKYRRPQHLGFSYLAVEALEYSQCPVGTCSETTKKKLAETTFELSDQFIKDYAEVLRIELQDHCLRDSDFQCAISAVKEANYRIEGAEFDWLSADAEGRVYTVSDTAPEKALKPLPGLTTFTEDMISSIEAVFPDGIEETGEITASIIDDLSDRGYDANEGGIYIDDIENPIQVWAKGDIVKIVFDANSPTCSWVAKNYDKLGAIEATVDRELIRPFDKDICSGIDEMNISIAFDTSKE
ncbi:hypothetical protein [Sulfitobacter sp. R18_1]|uniref:hypothetical protein n=1 Tax=Sulfitobacter sp. R18_1 TaxID=2821104 RepID=UPI001ADA7CBD|nr:hypothetical protein [Sulfitobacter sp. R18_1]MBO9428329.1 hypothetical protein [Sulfitobacter sp. R18_1]